MKRFAGIRSVIVGIGVLCASFGFAQGQECSGGMFKVFKDDIDKTKEQASDYKPGERNYYVQDFNDRKNVYLRAAISPSQRTDFMERFAADLALAKCVGTWIDELTVIAKRTLPTYRPAGYTTRTPAEDKLLRGAISDISSPAVTVLRSGVEGPNWRIDKNEYGIPTSRFKYGMVYVKNTAHDDGFCRIVWVNIVQDYSGGGTYGASVGNYIKSEPAGCPAGN